MSGEGEEAQAVATFSHGASETTQLPLVSHHTQLGEERQVSQSVAAPQRLRSLTHAMHISQFVPR